MRRLLALALLITLAGCASANQKSAPVGPNLVMQFQNGQSITVELFNRNQAVQNTFLAWVGQGVYTNTPVYRQLPGIFILTGKPRLAGRGFMPGPAMVQLEKQPSAKTGQMGLVVHADGTVGPEIYLQYGYTLRECCTAPATIPIGKINNMATGKKTLASIERGDNLINIAIQP